MIRFKFDVLKALKDAGWSANKLRNEKKLSESTMQRIRTSIKNNDNIVISTPSIEVICLLLKKQPGQILEFVKDQEPEAAADQE